MDEQKTKLSEEEQLKQLAAKMQEAEYKGLSKEEIHAKKQQKEMHRKRNVQILEDTLDILKSGSYLKKGKEVKIPLSPEQMSEIQVFLPDEIDLLRKEDHLEDEFSTKSDDEPCTFSCKNMDAIEFARKIYQSLEDKETGTSDILVLNLASATQPGGHVRKGAGAQEEDLCRRTSLLLSLESKEAKRYYEYNQALKTRMGSDAIMISPNVEVIKDSSSRTILEPFQISIMSCAAPMVRLGLNGMSQQEYEAMLYKRIQGLFLVAASQQYRHLILGAFGCGVYGNDAALISDVFYRVIQEFTYKGATIDQIFDSIDFAVLCHPDKDYNYREFSRNFS